MIDRTDRLNVRWLIRRDYPEILALDKLWCEEDIRNALKQRHIIGQVIETETEVLGYMIYELHPKKYELLHIAIGNKRQGLGSKLINNLKTKLAKHHRTKLRMVVPETNLIALLFLKANDFVATRVIRNHFMEPNEDGIVMVYSKEVPYFHSGNRRQTLQ